MGPLCFHQILMSTRHFVVDWAHADGERALVARLLARRGRGDLALRVLEVAVPLELAEETHHGDPPQALERGGCVGRHGTTNAFLGC